MVSIRAGSGDSLALGADWGDHSCNRIDLTQDGVSVLKRSVVGGFWDGLAADLVPCSFIHTGLGNGKKGDESSKSENSSRNLLIIEPRKGDSATYRLIFWGLLYL